MSRRTPNEKKATLDKIQVKLAQVERCNIEIQQLETRLITLRQKRDRFKKEIEEYRSSIAPIHNVPNEVLSLIFEQYVLEDPTHIRRLLLVCRKWHEMVIGDRLLWSQILIIGSAELDRMNNLQPYVEACLHRSKDGPLDIEINLEHTVPDIDIANMVIKCLEPFSDEDQLDLWAESQDFLNCPASEGYIDIYRKLVELVVGEEGDHMRRWQSFKFFGPDIWQELFDSVWNMMIYPAPKLEYLLLSGLEYIILESEIVPFPSLESIKVIDLPGMAVNISGVTSAAQKAQNLTIRAGLNISSLSSLQNLRVLHIFAPFIPSSHFQEPSQIILSRLAHLKLSGRFPRGLLACLDAPRLERLTLLGFSSDPGISTMPILSGVREVRYDYGVDIMRNGFEERQGILFAAS